jgi:hypothetical protein
MVPFVSPRSSSLAEVPNGDYPSHETGVRLLDGFVVTPLQGVE